MTGNSGQAANLLRHYFKTVFDAANLEWDSDNTVEMDALVAYLVEASVEVLKERQQAEAIAAAAKAPTHAALVEAGLLPPTATAQVVWAAAQDAFRRIAHVVGDFTRNYPAYLAMQQFIEAEAAALPGAPPLSPAPAQATTPDEVRMTSGGTFHGSEDEFSAMFSGEPPSREITPEAFGALLATKLVDGTAFAGEEDE